jgi:mono/diheme cytochrome c family protein
MLFVSFVFFVSFVVIAAQVPATNWDGLYTAEQAKRGQPLYNTNCAACHGDTLLGGEAAPALVGDVFNSNWEGVALADLFDRMRTTMPQNKPGSLSRAQVADVLAYILSVGQFPTGMKELEPQGIFGITYRTYRP